MSEILNTVREDLRRYRETDYPLNKEVALFLEHMVDAAVEIQNGLFTVRHEKLKHLLGEHDGLCKN